MLGRVRIQGGDSMYVTFREEKATNFEEKDIFLSGMMMKYLRDTRRL